MRPEVLTDLGGFAGLCALPTGYREPLLVSCTDGVGTKLKLAFLTGKHDTVGIDLVAMNVNDLVVCGAEPLFFLDYFASGKLDVGVAERVIAGHRRRLPAGRLRARRRRDRRAARLLRRRASTTWPGSASASSRRAAASTGAPSRRATGCSAWRRRDSTRTATRWCAACCSSTWGCDLDGMPAGSGRAARRGAAAPTRIYVRALRRLAAADLLRGAAHITGGGLVDNPTRMLPPGAKLKLQIDVGSWTVPPVFGLLARGGGVARGRDAAHLQHGHRACWSACPPARVAEARRLLEEEGERVFEVGQVAASDRTDAPVELRRA